MSADSGEANYVKATAITAAYSFGVGVLLWCLGVEDILNLICVYLVYFAFSLQILIRKSACGVSHVLPSVGVVIILSLLLFVGLQGLIHEFEQHGVQSGFILRWVS
jgi:hypothetical protein